MPRPALRRLPILLSEAAGHGRPQRHEPTIRAALAERFDVDPIYAPDLDHLLRALDCEVTAGSPMVAVGGGDGTLHHAINRIGDAPVTLAPLPLGTGNDFCRSLGLAPGLERALRAIVHGTARAVDLIEVQDRRVATVAGIGVVAQSALQVCRLGRPGRLWRPLVRGLGSYAYLGAGGLRLLFQPRLARAASVRWRAPGDADWRHVDGRYYGAFLAVRPTLGAGLRLPLEIAPDDGRFELVLIEPRGRVSVAVCLPRLRTARQMPEGLLSVYHVSEVVIEWDGGSALVGDGEDLGSAHVIHARLRPAALKVVAGEL